MATVMQQRIKTNLKKNGYVTITLSKTFVPANRVATIRKAGSCRSITVICPKCGRVGTLRSDTRGSSRKYQVIHNGCGVPYSCMFGRATNGFEFLDQIYRLVRQEWRL